MKTITIEVPEGKEAKWVNGVLTLVDEQPVEFKYKVGDKVHSTFDSVLTTAHIITGQVALDGEPYYRADNNQYALMAERFIRPCDEQPKDITERIKTFEDACEWCKDNGKQGLYEQYADALNVGLQRAKDILAYLKLRIITAALNEGWEPKFEEGEERYSVVCNTDNSAGDLTFYCSDEGFSYAEAVKLLFKNQALVKYAATQFKSIYMDFCYKGKE